jgi:hypothetical protein
MTAERMPPARGYAKPVVVPDRLPLLVGPTSGIVHLPRHLKWSGSARYDLDQPGRIADMYLTVLNEAATTADLYTYLEQATLMLLWPSLWLPMSVRRAWEERFPDLAERRHSAAA